MKTILVLGGTSRLGQPAVHSVLAADTCLCVHGCQAEHPGVEIMHIPLEADRLQGHDIVNLDQWLDHRSGGSS